jgi:hypothetical protein
MVGPITSLDASEQGKISHPCMESNNVIRPTTWSLYWLHYLISHCFYELVKPLGNMTVIIMALTSLFISKFTIYIPLFLSLTPLLKTDLQFNDPLFYEKDN